MTVASPGDGPAAATSVTSAQAASDTHDLPRRIRRFMALPSADDFDALALAAHHYQYRRNPAYARFADRHGRRDPRDWRDLPAVPADAFRDTALACGPAERVYASSGTSQGPDRRARHHVPDPTVYRRAALTAFQTHVLAAGERRPFLVAAPERDSHPASSLGEMVSWLREAHDAGAEPSLLRSGGVDGARWARCLDALDPDRPMLVLAITSALLAFGDWARERGRRWTLPAGSLVVDTGGCKGYPHPLDRGEILARYRATLGVDPTAVVNEYGMTELCSQHYARGLGPFASPHWVRTRVWDPRSGGDAPVGAAGLLRYVDLANVGSVVAVQTEDVGRRRADGSFELLGRAPHAEARGCSLLLAG